MDTYIAMDSATCAKNFYESAAEADKASSGFLGNVNTLNYYGNMYGPLLVMIPYILVGFISFGIGWILGYPFALLGVFAILPGVIFTLYFPNMENVIRWRIHEMTGYYSCAIGEEGFTAESFADLEKAANWIMVALENHEMFFEIPLGAIINNGGLIKDINLMIKEYNPAA